MGGESHGWGKPWTASAMGHENHGGLKAMGAWFNSIHTD